jgi:hypothetical protein
MPTSLTLMLHCLVYFDEEGVSVNSFATGVVMGYSSFPGMLTTTIGLLLAISRGHFARSDAREGFRKVTGDGWGEGI